MGLKRNWLQIRPKGLSHCEQTGVSGDRSNRKVFPFCNGLGDVDKSIAFPRKGENKVRNKSKKRVYRPGLVILGKLSPLAVVCFSSWKSSG